MEIQYDVRSDTLYFGLRVNPGAESEGVSPSIVVDYGEDEKMVGIKITGGSKFADLSSLAVYGLDTAVVHTLQ